LNNRHFQEYWAKKIIKVSHRENPQCHLDPIKRAEKHDFGIESKSRSFICVEACNEKGFTTPYDLISLRNRIELDPPKYKLDVDSFLFAFSAPYPKEQICTDGRRMYFIRFNSGMGSSKFEQYFEDQKDLI